MSLTFRIAQPHDGSTALNPSVLVTVTETGNGALRFDLKVEGEKGLTADLRGLFFHIGDEDLARSLSARGELLTGFEAAEDKVSNLKRGVNTEGVKSGPFDVGLAFGHAGIGKDDVREASFTLSSSKTELSLDLIQEMEFSARLTSVGEEGGKRDGSLKLVGLAVGETKPEPAPVPVPPPAPVPVPPPAPVPVPPPAPVPVPPPGTTQIGDWRDDRFTGTAGHDTMYGNGGHDRFDGGAGDDALHGNWGNDTMLGGQGRDAIYAEGGHDSLDGGEGSDRIYAGAGHDTVQGGGGDDLIESGDGNDLAMGGAGNDEIQGEGGDDTIIGGQDNGSIKDGAFTIGDNLYGNDGRDTFIFEKGDGVDLVWDFQAGTDTLVIKGYRFADMDAVQLVTRVTNNGRDGVTPLDAHAHQKLALVLDQGGDAIVFNDVADRFSTAGSVQFDDRVVSIRDLWAAAEKAAQPAPSAAPAGAEVIGTIKIVNSWWGGFQAEITVTATRDVTDWDIGLGSNWSVNNVWNAINAGGTGGVLDLDDANWNGTLSAGQSTTIGFTANTGMAGVMSQQAIMDGLWIV